MNRVSTLLRSTAGTPLRSRGRLGVSLLVGGSLIIVGWGVQTSSAHSLGKSGASPRLSANTSPYVVGVTSDLSSYGASTYSPITQGYQLYMKWFNAKGGVKGHKINLVVHDDKTDPSLVSQDIRSFTEQKTDAVFFADFTTTLSAYTTRAGDMPTLYGNACYPPATTPNPSRNFFCVGPNTATDYIGLARTAKQAFRKSFPGQKARAAIVEEDIPGCVSDMKDYAAPVFDKIGLTVQDRIVVPLSLTDMNATAQKLNSDHINVVLHYCSSSQMVNLASALKSIGWHGVYQSTILIPGLYGPMQNLKFPDFYGMDWFTPVNTKVGAWRDITQAARKYGASVPIHDLAWGWMNGIVTSTAFQKCGFPCSHAKLLNILNKFHTSDAKFKQLFADPLTWRSSNHTVPFKTYFIYHYSPSKNAIVSVFPRGLRIKAVPQLPFK